MAGRFRTFLCTLFVWTFLVPSAEDTTGNKSVFALSRSGVGTWIELTVVEIFKPKIIRKRFGASMPCRSTTTLYSHFYCSSCFTICKPRNLFESRLFWQFFSAALAVQRKSMLTCLPSTNCLGLWRLPIWKSARCFALQTLNSKASTCDAILF